MNDLIRYPIGKFEEPGKIDQGVLSNWIAAIESFPNQIMKATENLSQAELDQSYREDGWTVRQIVHHCADSHMNCLIRFKLALTEESPLIKPYNEKLWAELGDSRTEDIQASLLILEGLHKRWTHLLKSMKPGEWERTFHHPENGHTIQLKTVVGMYAWHGFHHLAHIQNAIRL